MKDFLTIHLRSNRANSRLSLFLLFIPALVFFGVLTFLTWGYQSRQVAKTPGEPTTLGTEAESLDKTK